jgi:hypothetical protein
MAESIGTRAADWVVPSSNPGGNSPTFSAGKAGGTRCGLGWRRKYSSDNRNTATWLFFSVFARAVLAISHRTRIWNWPKREGTSQRHKNAHTSREEEKERGARGNKNKSNLCSRNAADDAIVAVIINPSTQCLLSASARETRERERKRERDREHNEIERERGVRERRDMRDKNS